MGGKSTGEHFVGKDDKMVEIKIENDIVLSGGESQTGGERQEMRILRRLKNPKIKRLAITALAVSIFGVNYKCSKDKENRYEEQIERIKIDFAQKEQQYSRKISDLELRLNPFRFYDYDSSGVLNSEIDAIRNEKLQSSAGDSFEKYRLKDVTAEEIKNLAEKWIDEHRKFSPQEKDSLDKKMAELLPRLQDSTSAYRDESYLRDVAVYRRLIVEKSAQMAIQGHHVDKEIINYWQAPDEKLASERKIFGHIIMLKRDGRVYGSQWEFRRDVSKYKLMQHVIDARQFVKFNNAMIDDIKLSYRQIFEAGKEIRIKKLQQQPRKQPTWWDKAQKMQQQSFGR